MMSFNNTTKRLAILFFSILLLLDVNAQELNVKSMNAIPMDLSAATKCVNDLNGNACGLVKVLLATTGAVFEGSVIGPVEYKTGEYWVYMPAGSHILKVKHPNFLPLTIDFRDYGIQNIESKCTYELAIVMPQTTPSNVDDGMRYLIVTVNPQIATVFIDDRIQTVQNGTVSLLLPHGRHTYRVEASGYESKSGIIDVNADRTPLNVSLNSELSSITVSCQTKGAQIFVNESLKGNSPWSGQLPSGNYQIEARLNGYHTQRQSISLAPRQNKTIEIPSLKPITGVLNVNYQPINAEIWVDGQKVGVSPNIFRDINIGRHMIEVRANGYETVKKSIDVMEGKTIMLSGSLTSASTEDLSSAIKQEGANYNSIAPAKAKVPVPEAIDLGLSVKWASFNLGASKPEEAGNYYAWGETETKSEFSWDNYKYAKGDEAKLTKYCTRKKFGFKNFKDNRMTLLPEDDAAATNLGGNWRLPTEKEIKELINNCNIKWTEVNGVKGVNITGPNGNSIFMPAAGISAIFYNEARIDGLGKLGLYWASSSGSSMPSFFAYCYSFIDSKEETYLAYGSREEGYTIRPVLSEK